MSIRQVAGNERYLNHASLHGNSEHVLGGTCVQQMDLHSHIREVHMRRPFAYACSHMEHMLRQEAFAGESPRLQAAHHAGEAPRLAARRSCVWRAPRRLTVCHGGPMQLSVSRCQAMRGACGCSSRRRPRRAQGGLAACCMRRGCCSKSTAAVRSTPTAAQSEDR